MGEVVRLVTETGEIPADCPNCHELAVQVAGLEREIRAWRSRYAKLAQDRKDAAQEHPLYEDLERVFGFWRSLCDHPRSKWTEERFYLALPFYEREGEYECAKAIAGIAFDPNTRALRNGNIERYDAWETLFKSQGTFDRYRNRAPRG